MPRIYDNGVLVADVPDPVPDMITNYQARKTLMAAGLFDAVDAAVKAGGGETLQAWEYANHFYRADPIIGALSAALGLNDAQVDALFLTASTIA